MNYKTLKNKIAEILLDTPADLYDDEKGMLFQTDTWELVQDRENLEEIEIEDDEELDLKAVGSANLIVANTLFKKALSQNINILEELKRVSSNNIIYETKESADDLFELIMTDLENERIIRKKPEIVRQGFKVVGGTDVGINSPA